MFTWGRSVLPATLLWLLFFLGVETFAEVILRGYLLVNVAEGLDAFLTRRRAVAGGRVTRRFHLEIASCRVFLLPRDHFHRGGSFPLGSHSSPSHSAIRPSSSTRMTASPSGRFGASTSRTIRLSPFDLRRYARNVEV